ncbi:ABC transporter permease [Tsukamurella pulmonis]|uniref:FtsX-like permease family protein n=2 Tax=Tsukamurella pulmonis TaxID=47312 RepID=UPI00079CAE90|nr:ABC transporter permease [Tsukamurella pulmonis]KXP12277.1 ABC transporter permease [Tsukamurella pulmonis]
MYRYGLRILLADARGWWPAITTIAMITALVGLCATQFAWARDPRFVAAVEAQGRAVSEFTIVAQTIYVVVAALGVFALTVVGNATVEATRRTFAQWRLVGASPRDVRHGIWALVATAALIGAVPGSFAALVAAYFAVPIFNEMAAPGFAAPTLPPSPFAWFLSLAVGVLTCLLGAVGPARRGARTRAIVVFRSTGVTPRRDGWWRVPAGALLLVAALGMIVAASSVGPDTGVAALFNLSLYTGLCAVAAVYVLGPLVVPVILMGFGHAAACVGSVIGSLAAAAAVARAGTSANTVAPLAAGVGGIGVMLASVESTAAVVTARGDATATNLTDTLVLAGLISVVLLVTSAAVIALASRDRDREQALLRVAGMPRRQVTAWYGWQALQLALAGVVLAVVPVALTVTAAAVGSPAFAGRSVVSVPWAVPVFGFALIWLVLSLVLWLPARTSLRAEPAAGLRAA